MKVRLHDLDETGSNALKELCQKHSISYSNDKEDEYNIFKVFEFDIDDNVLVLSTVKGVTVAIKTGVYDYVFIEPDMFFSMDIL